jgi:hypothetical protein
MAVMQRQTDWCRLMEFRLSSMTQQNKMAGQQNAWQLGAVFSAFILFLTGDNYVRPTP